MGEDPRDIQQRIENTRKEMGETVDALAHKADVPGRVKGAVHEKKDTVVEKVAGARERLSGAASSAANGGGSVAGHAQTTARKGVGVARENPFGLTIGAIAAGFLVGMLIPSTRIEDQQLGPVADHLKEQAREVASEAVDQGKQVAQEVAQSATTTAREAAGEHAHHLREAVAPTDDSLDTPIQMTRDPAR